MAEGRRKIRRVTAAPRAAEPPRDLLPPIDELLDNVRELRLTFVADLASAAGALDAGEPDLAAEIVEADRLELDLFLRRADERLRDLEAAASRPAPSPRWRRRIALAVPAVPLVGALTMSAAAAFGVLSLPGSHAPTTAAASAPHIASGVTPALTQFESIVNGNPSAQQVIAAGNQLHAQIAELLASSDNPATVAVAEHLLQLERNLLLSKQPPGAVQALRATYSFINQLHHIAPTTYATPNVATQVTMQPTTSASPTPSKKASPSPTPSKKPSSSPSASSSPSPSPSSTDPTGPIPKVGG